MVVSAVGCNALTGVGDLAVGEAAAPVVTGNDASTPDAARPVDASAPADAADALDDAGAEAAVEAGPTEKRVFVTSSSTTGNLGGLAGADAKCEAAASAAGLGGTWVAYLSVQGVVDARDRPTAAGPWYRVDGQLAVTRAELSNAPITRAVDRDENGSAVTSGFVWTGTDGSGQFFDDDCNGWTSMSSMARACLGDPTVRGDSWLRSRPGGCDEQYRLYCFQQ